MDDLEQQIRAWVDAEAEGVGPVTVADVFARGDAPAPSTARVLSSRRRSTTVTAAVAVAAALVLVVVGLTQLEARDDDTMRLTPPPPTVPKGWQFERVPVIGWTFVAPPGWTVSSWDGYCDGTSGSLVVNASAPVPRTTEPEGCNSAWEPFARNRSDIVALAIIDDAALASTTDPDTEVPLSLDDLEPHDPAPGEPIVRTATLVDDGDQSQHIEVWIGADATNEDLQTLRRMLASVAPPTPAAKDEQSAIVPAMGSPRSTTFLTCMIDNGFDPRTELLPRPSTSEQPKAEISWPDGQQDRSSFVGDRNACAALGDAANNRLSREFSAWPEHPGPSQTPGDAARDGVVPAVAALTLKERATPTSWFDAPEGTWAITRMPAPPEGNGSFDCTVGDGDGTWGDDYVCSSEYGEVLLVDDDGAIVRSYPMPGATPSWITATDDAVYAGRTGDGGLPDSTIVRIDRTTLAAEVLVFPAEPGRLGISFPNWSVAPNPEAIGDLVQVSGPDDPIDPSRTLVTSWVGITSIDLPAIEDLFA